MVSSKRIPVHDPTVIRVPFGFDGVSADRAPSHSPRGVLALAGFEPNAFHLPVSVSLHATGVAATGDTTPSDQTNINSGIVSLMTSSSSSGSSGITHHLVLELVERVTVLQRDRVGERVFETVTVAAC